MKKLTLEGLTSDENETDKLYLEDKSLKIFISDCIEWLKYNVLVDAFLGLYNITIYFSSSMGKFQEPLYNKNNINIFVNYYPTESVQRNDENKITCSTIGKPIIYTLALDNDKGRIQKSLFIGEIIDKNIYLYFSSKIPTLRKLHHSILRGLYQILPEEEFLIENKINDINDILNIKIKNDIDNQKASVENTKKQIQQTKNEFMKLFATLTAEQALLEKLKLDAENRANQQKEDIIKAIKKYKKVNNVFFINKNIMLIDTDTLYCTDPRTKLIHEIGKFIIIVNFDSQDISWYNKNNTISGYDEAMQAPHVFPGGNACLGNPKKAFYRMLSTGDIVGIIVLAIQFIESVNVDDSAGKYINVWPTIKEKEGIND